MTRYSSCVLLFVSRQAVLVEIEPAAVAALCKNAHPHVTISHAAGTAAVYSNELLAHTAVEPAADLTKGGVFMLSGVVGAMVEKAQGLELLSTRLRQQVIEPRHRMSDQSTQLRSPW